LSSGEGLIWSVRDPIFKLEPKKENKVIVDYQEVMIDSGVEDKRLFVIEQEFAATLKVMSRESNILSATIRQAWDDGDLRTLTKNSPAKATGAHISILGHITQDELLRYLSTTEAGNGFANRFLWACVRRARLLPDGGNLDPNALHALGEQLGLVFENSQYIGLIERDSAANERWHEVYGALSDGGVGLMGAITSRAEAYVMRLASIYTLLDESNTINLDHLNAALALWEYTETSAAYIFGDRLGDPVADSIMSALRHGELTRTDIRDLFGRNLSATRMDQALGALLSAGKVKRDRRETGGRPVEVWVAT
jgi:hypothetical protein